MEQVSTERQDFVICPYCYNQFEDCYGLFKKLKDGQESMIECNDCDNIFKMSLEIEMYYSTERIIEE